MVLTVKDFVASTGFRVWMRSSERSGVAQYSYWCGTSFNLHIVVVPGSGSDDLVGDHMQGVTPVPIPNTEVKPLQPMILLSGKVGYRRLYGLPRVTPGEALFIFAPWLSSVSSRTAVNSHDLVRGPRAPAETFPQRVWGLGVALRALGLSIRPRRLLPDGLV